MNIVLINYYVLIKIRPNIINTYSISLLLIFTFFKKNDGNNFEGEFCTCVFLNSFFLQLKIIIHVSCVSKNRGEKNQDQKVIP